MSIYDTYELVVGLEVHAQLSTYSKAYAEDVNEYGALPNSHLSAVTLGLPGTLPVVNEKVIEYAVKMGIATHCTINTYNGYARKNYFYADLPKGYQITQDKTPICTQGYLEFKVADAVKKVGITRIHMEEDAGKSLHDQDVHYSLVDLNRAGVPLIEIVSEPDIRSSEEAAMYLMEIRKLLRYLEICDGNMEEGSMRCDANISVRRKGTLAFGNRCEVKNLNSFKNVQRAIEFEFKRQVDALERGERIQQNTLNFNAISGETSVLRTKEMANDYRYFPEPDIPPVILDQKYISAIKTEMPMLPEQLLQKFITEYHLPETDARILIENKAMLHYFEACLAFSPHHKSICNWLLGPIKSYLNEKAIGIEYLPLHPSQLTDIIDLIETNKISFSNASQKLLPLVFENEGTPVQTIALKHNLLLEATNIDEVDAILKEIFAQFPDKVSEYKSGKKGLLGLFMGELMKKTHGKLNPKEATAIVQKQLDNE